MAGLGLYSKNPVHYDTMTLEPGRSERENFEGFLDFPFLVLMTMVTRIKKVNLPHRDYCKHLTKVLTFWFYMK